MAGWWGLAGALLFVWVAETVSSLLEYYAAKAGITDLNAKYTRDDMCRDDVIFAATGVTDGSILRGARRVGAYLETETILMRSRTGSVRRLIYRTRNA